jgi:hypothetical protein
MGRGGKEQFSSCLLPNDLFSNQCIIFLEQSSFVRSLL